MQCTMKPIWRKCAAALLAAVMLFAGMPVWAAQQNDVVITGLKVNSLTDPVGIDDVAPQFSWYMVSDTVGQKQTAYRIVVQRWDAVHNCAGDTVWDTGRVTGDQCRQIAYAGAALEPSTVYVWQPQVWDKDGNEAAPANPGRFETGLMQQNALGDVHWLRAPKQTDLAAGTPDYRLDADFTILTGSASVVFGGDTAGGTYYYSTILPSYSGTVNGKQISGPAVLENLRAPDLGTITAFDGGAITGATSASMTGTRHHIAVTASQAGGKNAVQVLVDGKTVLSHDNLDRFSYNGKIGFLSTPGSDVLYDNVTVETAGATRFSADFDTGENPFAAGTVSNGQLELTGSDAALLTGTIGGLAQPRFVHYAVETDMTILSDAIGIVFSATDASNMDMWQFNGVDHKDAQGNGVFYLRRHIWTNGAVQYQGLEKDLSGYFSWQNDILNKKCHVKIEVTSSAVSTYINGVLVDTFAQTGLYDGRVGFRSGTDTETGAFDNLKLTEYDESGAATVKYNDDFSTGVNPVEGGTIQNGRLVVSNLCGPVFVQQGLPTFRKAFTAAQGKQVASARVYASALGVYDLYCNGQRVGQSSGGQTVYDELKPGWTDYNKRVFYNTLDITDLLRAGSENVLLATVSTGWWTGRISYGTYGNKDMAFIAKVLVTYTDGTQDVFGTDDTWQCSQNGAYRQAGIWDGETYDATCDTPAAVSSPGYDASQWGGVLYSTDFNGVVSAYTGPGLRVRSDLFRTPQSYTVYQGTDANSTDYGAVHVVGGGSGMPASVTLSAGQTAIFDIGQDMAGWPRVALQGAKGTAVVLHFAEMLNDSGKASRGNDGPQGSLYEKNYRSARSTATYILRGDAGGETYTPTLTYFGFRYISVTATADVTITGLQAQPLTTIGEETGSITTSDPTVNQLFSNILWGQRSNYNSVPTDCPQRDERLGWTGDTQIFSGAAAYNADVQAFFHKWAQDARDSQATDGEYSDIIPQSNAVGNGGAGWADAGIIVPYNMYQMYGDTQVVKDAYGSMQKYMSWLATTSLEGPNQHYGDWLAYEGTPNRLISIVYYAYDAQLMQQMALALGKTGDAAQYANTYSQVKAHFQSIYMDSNGALNDASQKSQTAYLLALKVGLFPTEQARQAAAATLAQKIAANGNKLSTGFVGTGILNQTLSDAGLSNTAYTLLLQRDNPSWLYSVDQGATTVWERWNSYTLANGFGDAAMNSFNHYSYGAVAQWMYSDMLGIAADPANPGFKHILLSPKPDTRAPAEIPANEKKLTSASGSYRSVYGNIKAAWSTQSGMFQYSATVPANTTATLTLPKLSAQSNAVVINGVSYAIANLAGSSIPGVQFVSASANSVKFELQSGSYTLNEAAEQAGISLDKTSLALTETTSSKLTATLTGAAAGNTVSWVSSNPAIATVDSTGNVTAVSSGTATVTATVSGVSAGCTVTVQPLNASLSAVSGYADGIKPGTTAAQLTQNLLASGAVPIGTQLTVTDAAGVAVTGNVGTGMTLKAGAETYTIVMYGDIDGDGQVNSTDLLVLKRSILGLTPLSGAAAAAANVTRDAAGQTDSTDLLLLKRSILGLGIISQAGPAL